MNTMNGLSRAALAAILSLATLNVGCMAESGAPSDGAAAKGGEATASTSEAFSSYGGYTWRVNGYGTSPANIGSSANQTCFLTGVAGDLRSDSAPGDQGNYATSPVAAVIESGGYWYLEVYGTEPTEGSIEITAMCLPTVKNRTAIVSWSTGQAAQWLGAATANRQCFLNGVYNTDEYYPSPGSWSSQSDMVRTWSDGYNWWIGGTGAASGSAVCVDVDSFQGGWEWVDGTGQRNDNLAYNNGTNGGVQCGLTGLLGSFRTDNWADGVFVNYISSDRQWQLQTNNGKGGYSTCFN